MLTPFHGGALCRDFCVLTYNKSAASCLTCSIGSLAHRGLASEAAFHGCQPPTANGEPRTANREPNHSSTVTATASRTAAFRYSRFRREIKVRLISAGHTASHS